MIKIIGAPLIVGSGLGFCALRQLYQSSQGKTPPLGTVDQQLRAALALLTLIFLGLLIAISAIVSAFIWQLGLAVGRTDLGNIDPVLLFGIFAVFAVGLRLMMHFDAIRAEGQQRLRRWLYLSAPVLVLVSVAVAFVKFEWSGQFFAHGTGIGLIVSLIAIALSVLYLARISFVRLP
jgi:hypothetical protein